MSFYQLSKSDRVKRVAQIRADLEMAVQAHRLMVFENYFGDSDTYIRKAAYQETGKIFWINPQPTLDVLKVFMTHTSFHVRQSTVNAAGEIGRKDFQAVQSFFDAGLMDAHHTVRNAVIGSIKKMSAVNPVPVLEWARLYLQHEDKEIRREICHGIELRGRTHPQDILPLLKELQWDETARVRNTLVHVLGQIAYKKDCLATVLNALKNWENTKLVAKALEEILDVHHRYKDFAVFSVEQAQQMIDRVFMDAGPLSD